MHRARLWRPGTNPGGRAGLAKIDGRARAEIMPLAVAREVLLVRAPAELGRLRALGNEAVDRPGIDELVLLLRDRGDLSIAFGHVHHAHAQGLRQLGPAHARARYGRADTGVGRDVEQRLLVQM